MERYPNRTKRNTVLSVSIICYHSAKQRFMVSSAVFACFGTHSSVQDRRLQYALAHPRTCPEYRDKYVCMHMQTHIIDFLIRAGGMYIKQILVPSQTGRQTGRQLFRSWPGRRRTGLQQTRARGGRGEAAAQHLLREQLTGMGAVARAVARRHYVAPLGGAAAYSTSAARRRVRCAREDCHPLCSTAKGSLFRLAIMKNRYCHLNRNSVRP